MSHIRKFHEQVKKQSELFHPEDPSTFAIATLLYPSKYCWFKDDGPLPSKNYQNKLGMMKSLNNKLMRFNNNVLQEQVLFYKRMMGDDWGVDGLVSKPPRYALPHIRNQEDDNNDGTKEDRCHDSALGLMEEMRNQGKLSSFGEKNIAEE